MHLSFHMTGPAGLWNNCPRRNFGAIIVASMGLVTLIDVTISRRSVYIGYREISVRCLRPFRSSKAMKARVFQAAS